jgi:poly(3-hydroxybutyrate) depolymerase
MKKIFLTLAVFTVMKANAQCDGNRYLNYIFNEVQVTSNVVYGENVKYDGTSQTLLCDIYEPVGDNVSNRAAVIVAHGGFFLSGSKTGNDVVPICQRLAKMGYVAISIEYRLGVTFLADLSGPMTEAVMRGVQDGKAAVRFLRKTVAVDGNPYNIDANEIYIAGSSAGGYIALHMAYLDDMAELPAFVNTNNPGLTGELEGNSGNPGYPSDIKAIVNICGAIGDTAWIQAGDEPALLFHGTDDQTVPYGSAMQYAFGISPVVEVDGSSSINEKMNQVGLEHCFEIYEGQDHVPHMTNTFYLDTTMSIMSNFLAHHICSIPLDCNYRTISVGTEELSINEEDLVVYPNPASSNVFISSNDLKQIEVYNMTGEMVKTEFNVNRMEISNLPNGLYVFRITTSKGKTNKTVIIQH